VALGQVLLTLPGVQTHGRHIPALRQACMAAHGAAAYPSPSLLQTLRVLTSTQDGSPGTHARGTHAPALQVWALLHAAVV